MKTNNENLQKILNQPSYWIESINGFLYEAILNYMETNNLNRTELSQHLGISKGRVSQILNDGEINFSIEKLIEISLKIGKYPVFEFKKIDDYITEQKETKNIKKISIDFSRNNYTKVNTQKENKGTKIISLHSNNNYKFAL